MSNINHKAPKKTEAHSPFEPLNNRKNARPPSETIGQTYGERRQKSSAEGGWVQQGLNKARDFFLGSGKKSNNIQDFSNSHDRYEGAHQNRFSANTAIDRNARLEKGIKSHAVTKPASEQYLRFLDSVITYTGPQRAKTAKKV